MTTDTSTSRDPRVEAAISHWAPRFVANGVPLTDFQEVTASLARWDDWCGAWSARASAHETLGEEALANGCTRSAGEHFTRAGVCYHFAKFVFVHRYEEMRAAQRSRLDRLGIGQRDIMRAEIIGEPVRQDCVIVDVVLVDKRFHGKPSGP